MLRSSGICMLLALLVVLPLLAAAQLPLPSPPSIRYALGSDVDLYGSQGKAVYSMALSADGLSFATASDDSTVKVWRMSDGMLLRTFVVTGAHTPYALSVALSPDGTAVAAGDTNNMIWMWSLVDDSQIHIIPSATGGSSVYSLSYSSDGSTLAASGTGGNANAIYLYKTSDGSLQKMLTNNAGNVYQIAFSPVAGQATLLAAIYQDLTVRFWNTKTGSISATPVTPFANQANCLAFSRDGSQIAVGGLDSSTNANARVWSVVNGSIGSMKANLVAPVSGNPVSAIAFSQDGTLLAAGAGNLVDTFTIPSGTAMSSFNRSDAVTGLAFSNDGSVITSSGPNYIYQSSVATGLLVQAVTQLPGNVSNVAFSSDSSQMALGLGASTLLQFRSGPTGAMLPVSLNNSITDINPFTFTFSPDGTLFALSGAESIYSVSSGASLIRGGAVGAYLLVSADDQEVYTLTTGAVTVYRMADGVQLGVNVLTGSGGYYAISNDQTRVLCPVSGGVSVFSLPDGATISPQPILSSNLRSNYSLSGDGSYVAFGIATTVYIYRVSDGMPMLTQPGAANVVMVAISPFGDSVAAYRSDGSITVTGIDGTQYGYWNDQLGTGIIWMGYTPDASSIVLSRSDSTMLVCFNPAPAALSGLQVTPSIVEGGLDNIYNPQAIVSINVAAPFDVPITLTSSDPAVTFAGTQTTTATITQGATSAVVPLTTTAVFGVNKTVAITATLNGVTIIRNITLRPAIKAKAVTFAPSTVQGGLPTIGVVTLVSAAPTGGTPVLLTGNSYVVIPAVVTVPTGLRSVKFLVQTTAVQNQQSVTISAKSGGATITSSKLILVPAALSAVSALPSTIQSGENSIGVIQLAAPTLTNVTVAVSSSNTAVASLDVSSVTIPAGQMLGTFNITAGTVATNTKVTITAKLYSVIKTSTVTVTP